MSRAVFLIAGDAEITPQFVDFTLTATVATTVMLL